MGYCCCLSSMFRGTAELSRSCCCPLLALRTLTASTHNVSVCSWPSDSLTTFNAVHLGLRPLIGDYGTGGCDGIETPGEEPFTFREKSREERTSTNANTRTREREGGTGDSVLYRSVIWLTAMPWHRLEDTNVSLPALYGIRDSSKHIGTAVNLHRTSQLDKSKLL